MPEEKNYSGVAFPIENSSLYAAWQRERRAIDEHKWYLSEKSGRDVGFSYAQWNWIFEGHRERWLKIICSGTNAI